MPAARHFLTRRSVLGALAGAAAVGLYTWRVEPHWLEIVRRPLPIRNLPPALEGCTLLQLSDMHVGRVVSDAYILDVFARTAALGADIVVLTGDMMSYHPDVFPQLRAIYRQVPVGRLATVAIIGNHDYGPNWGRPDLAARVVDELSTFGVRFLRNASVDVHGLQIVGLDDLWAHSFAPEAVLRALDREQAALVLSHNPDTVDLPVWQDYQGWILAGHTHGGQCKPPFLPPPLLPVKNRLYTSGEFALAGRRRMYISRGVGHLLQVRFNVRPEGTLFELRREVS